MNAILCRIGWMNTYSGPGRIYFGKTDDDFYERDGICGEYWNFLHGEDGIIRGFVMLTARDRNGDYTGTININRLGANSNDEYIDDIMVIFYAPQPDNNSRYVINYVVGYYQNARIFRNWSIVDHENDNNNEYREYLPYNFHANPQSTVLIPTSDRNIEVITSQYARSQGIPGKYPGQAPVFFGDDEDNEGRRYINSIIKKLQLNHLLEIKF